MEAFGIPPSKRLGDIKHQLEADIEDGALEPGKDADHYVAYLNEHAADYGLDES